MYPYANSHYIEWLHVQDLVAYSLNLTNFWVAKSVETSEHSKAAQKSRNDSQEMLLHLEMYRPFNKCTTTQ